MIVLWYNVGDFFLSLHLEPPYESTVSLFLVLRGVNYCIRNHILMKKKEYFNRIMPLFFILLKPVCCRSCFEAIVVAIFFGLRENNVYNR